MLADARELLACEGIGPARLDKYGDEILGVLDAVRGGVQLEVRAVEAEHEVARAHDARVRSRPSQRGS